MDNVCRYGRAVKTPSERGPFGAWLVEQRTALSTTRGRKVLQRDVVIELAAAGYPIEESYYRALEGGSKLPGRELRDRLGQFFGASPPTSRPHPAADTGEVVAAIREQTAAISELALSVRLLVAATLKGDEDALREEVTRLVLGAAPAHEPAAPQPGMQP